MPGRISGASRRCLLLVVALSSPARAFDDADAARVLGFAREQLARTDLRGRPERTPKASLPGGGWTTVPSDDAVGWTQGFYPGSLWLLFDASAEPAWRRRAERWTAPLEVQKANRQTHDLGFKVFCSFGQAQRLAPSARGRAILLETAASLATRYRPAKGFLDAADWNSAWKDPLVIDTMMNLELLLWAARNGGPEMYQEMALHHALRTLEDAVRPDGGTYQVVDYEPSGEIRFKGTFQGHSHESTWARGQAWAIHGFTTVYRFTRDPRMLAAAQRVTEYWLSRVPSDGVPNWDFDDPAVHPDSSAAAVVASALLELSGYVTDAPTAQRYRALALRTLDTLSGPGYLAAGSGSPGLLLHAVGNLPAGQEIDVSLVYGDYYFLEAVLRFNPQPARPWYAATGFADGLRSLGGPHRGRLSLALEVTPRKDKVLDGTIGYADADTKVVGYPSLPILVRLNSAGRFDARDGETYRAVSDLPYRANQTYRLRLEVDLPARRYSAWVRGSADAAEQTLADGFAFRSDAPPADDLGQLSLRTAGEEADFLVTSHQVVTSGGEPAPDPGPTPEPLPETPSSPVDAGVSSSSPDAGPSESAGEEPPVEEERRAGCAAAGGPGWWGAALSTLAMARLRRGRRR